MKYEHIYNEVFIIIYFERQARDRTIKFVQIIIHDY